MKVKAHTVQNWKHSATVGFGALTFGHTVTPHNPAHAKTAMPDALGLRLWLSGIVTYNVVSGVLAIVNPAVLNALFPGSAAIFGEESSMLSRVLGSYALSIAGVRALFVANPTSRETFLAVLWTFFVFESMFAIEVVHGTVTLGTVLFGVVAGTVSVLLMSVYRGCGWLTPTPITKAKPH